MTFTEILHDTLERLNLSSDEAKARIGRAINTRYRQITSSIGLVPTRRTQVSQAATIGNRNITFSGIEKIESVIDKSSGVDEPLEEISHAEMTKITLRAEPPKKYSIYTVAPTTVTIRLDCVPTTTFTLYADGLATSYTLSSNEQPAFPESFHDVVIYGVMADEFMKQEKADLAKVAEAKYETRLSDLRMFLAKTGYKDIFQGKSKTYAPRNPS